MISGVLSAIVTSFICILLHFIICLFTPSFPKFDSDVKKLIFQGKMVLSIWLIMLPLFFLLNNIFVNKGIDEIIKKNKIEEITFLLYSIVLFLCFFFLYLTVYYIIDRSVSSRIMIEIEKSPSKKLTFEELIKIYDVDTKYQNEIKGMEEGSFIKKEGDKYKCTVKGLIVGRIAFFLKSIWKLGEGG